MGSLDPYGIGTFIALYLGALLVVGGLFGRRHGRLRRRESFELLASFVAIIGALVLCAGFYGLLRG